MDTTQPGTYQVTYSVTNSAGLSASVSREVRVLAPGWAARGTSSSAKLTAAVPGISPEMAYFPLPLAETMDVGVLSMI